VVVSLYVTVDMFWSGVREGHGTHVSRTGLWTGGFVNSTCHWVVEVYVPQVLPQEAPVVFGYMTVSSELYTPNVYRSNTHKYVGHETVKW
jgi:hypothetical protein